MLSLVLTYRNRDLKIVKRCLGSLKIQSDQDFKVFLVNYGSSDKFTAEIEGLVKLYDFIDYIFVPTYGQLWNKSKAINIALKKCTTSYFLMGDIDLIYHPEMIEKCKQLVEKYSNVSLFSLSKNVGEHNAIMAGLEVCEGEKVITMDDDLQHNPASINDLLNEIDKGFDVCYTKYLNRQHLLWKKIMSWINNLVASHLL